MEWGPWEANSCLATQEIPSILWNLKAYHCVHKSHPLVPPTSSSWIWFTITQPTSLRTIWILSSHLSLLFSSGLFPSSCPTKTSTPLLSHACYIDWTSHCPWFYHSNNSWWGVKFMKLLLMQFPQHPVNSSLLGRNILLGHPHSQTPSTYILPLMWETKFHAYTKNYRKNYSFVYFNIYIFYSRQKTMILNWMVQRISSSCANVSHWRCVSEIGWTALLQQSSEFTVCLLYRTNIHTVSYLKNIWINICVCTESHPRFNKTYLKSNLGSHSSGYEEFYLLRYNIM
jgi:hypothetical protein